MKFHLAALLLASAAPALAQTSVTSLPQPVVQDPKIAALRDDALHNDHYAWEIVEGLTTEVGQRLAATEAEARARDWAVAKLRAMGFSNVHVEPFDMPVWTRGAESAEILSPFPQKLVIAALGYSGSTGPEGVTGEIVYFDSVDALRATPDSAVKGKIVFIDHHMMPAQDGSGYGQFGAPRRQGPTIASKKGALAIVIRSIGTDHHRNPHTGVQYFTDGATPIPAGALAVPDAEQLVRILKRGKPVVMHLTLVSEKTEGGHSGNVIAEAPGRDPKAPILLVGGHLDSWDLGTGVTDNGTGSMVVLQAARVIAQSGLKPPRRTIRFILFSGEEQGLLGSRAYAADHAVEADSIQAVLVLDNGTGAITGQALQGRDSLEGLWRDLLAPVKSLGADSIRHASKSGTDHLSFLPYGVPAFNFDQLPRGYSHTHHSQSDTFDKAVEADLKQAAAVMAVTAYELANLPELLPRGPKSAPERVPNRPSQRVTTN